MHSTASWMLRRGVSARIDGQADGRSASVRSLPEASGAVPFALSFRGASSGLPPSTFSRFGRKTWASRKLDATTGQRLDLSHRRPIGRL